MYIHGDFINEKGQAVSVYILTQGDRLDDREIGTDEAGIYFTADEPVTISNDTNDTFDHLLRQSATVTLLTSAYIPELFCASCRDAVVNIYRDGVCLFAGFIEPMSYSQPYNEVLDELELNCIDALSALQYTNYRGIGSASVTYDGIKGQAEQRTFYDIAKEILDGVTADIDILGTGAVSCRYDMSKAASDAEADKGSIFKTLALSELLFLGDGEDEVWTQDAVLEEMLRYLNLHIRQDGFTFYIFAWESIRAGKAISWCGLDGTAYDEETASDTVEIAASNVEDCDTSISIGEVYNQLLLTDSVTETENVVESPLDSDSLENVFDGQQLWMTEYSAPGEGVTAIKTFFNIVHWESFYLKGTYTQTDWYMLLRNNPQWFFHVKGQTEDLITYLYGSGVTPTADVVSAFMGSNMACALMSVGSIEKNPATDNSLTSRVSLTDCLVISVNGNGKDSEDEYRPNAADILAHVPLATYTGSVAGGTFSPADNDTTNYIIFSGKFILNAIQDVTDDYYSLWQANVMGDKDNYYTHDDTTFIGKYWHKTVQRGDYSENSDGRYYAREYYKRMPKTPVEGISPTNNGMMRDAGNYQYACDTDTPDHCFYPDIENASKLYEFKYSAVGDGTDKVSKVAVLACMLVIGDKCVVEKTPDDDLGTGVPYTGSGLPADFVWKKYKQRSECADDDEYYAQCFTIGFDPKIEDCLIGTEFEIQTNFDTTFNLDADGMAIPIHRKDHVSGAVQFQILGIVNETWDEITRRHPTFFRHTKWSTTSVPLMAHVSSIWVKDFEIEVKSDNGGYAEATGDNDIVYISDTDETYINKKDDIEFKITSALTSAECKALGVTNSVCISTPENLDTEDPVTTIYDRNSGETAKPEQIYVDSYWQEWHAPRVIMEQNMQDTGCVSFFNHYTHPAIGMTFHVQGIGRNLMEGSAQMTLKEIEQ